MDNTGATGRNEGVWHTYLTRMWREIYEKVAQN